MKSNNRVIVAALVANLLLPLAASAQTDRLRESPTSSRPRAILGQVSATAQGDAFCSRVSESSASNLGSIGMVKRGMMEKRDSRDEQREARNKGWDGTVKNAREDQDEHRADVYDKLEEKAGTDAKKAALETFKTDMDAAVAARRAAIDAANSAFQSGVKDAVAKRKAAIDAAVAKFEAAVKAALDKAKADCDSSDGVDGAKIRDAAMTAIKAAKAQLVADRQAADKVSDGVKPLIEAHKAAIEKAVADFKAAANKAKETLKASYDLAVNKK